MIRSYSSLLFWLGMTIAASLMLYHTSDRVNELDQQLHTLNAQIDSEQDSLHVLKAEWVYLANPARIEAEAQRHLDLHPTAPRRVAAMQNMGDLLPLQGRDALPTQVAQVTPTQTPAPVAHTVARSKSDRIVAALNAGRINDHMVMQHTASIQASTDSIGALIGSLGMHP
jgi:cell division protein FtsL